MVSPTLTHVGAVVESYWRTGRLIMACSGYVCLYFLAAEFRVAAQSGKDREFRKKS